MMRALVLAIAAVALLAAPANAQVGGGKRGGSDHAPAPEKPKIDEKAYKAALERVPTPRKNTIHGAASRQLPRPQRQRRKSNLRTAHVARGSREPRLR